MIEFSETVRIASSAQRVWQALTVPAEVAQWDTGIIAAIDAPPDYPRPGQYVRWRYRLGPFRLILHDRPSEVVEASVLRSSIRLGPFDFDETYNLEAFGPAGAGLSARLVLSSSVPVLGPVLERFPGAQLARSTVRESLQAIKHHCER